MDTRLTVIQDNVSEIKAGFWGLNQLLMAIIQLAVVADVLVVDRAGG